MPNQCISYETLRATLAETAKSFDAKFFYLPGTDFINGDPNAQHLAQGALRFLDEHPQAEKLVKEILSNSSCSDIAQLVQGFPSGWRDTLLARQLGGASQRELYRNMTEISTNFDRSIERASQNIYDASVYLTIGMIVWAIGSAAKAYWRRQSK